MCVYLGVDQMNVVGQKQPTYFPASAFSTQNAKCSKRVSLLLSPPLLRRGIGIETPCPPPPSCLSLPKEKVAAGKLPGCFMVK